MTSPDPFGRALFDHYRGEREAPLVQRDGAETLDHPIERFYFDEFDPGSGSDEGNEWLAAHLDGPLLDLGAGAGRHALFFQEHYETVAIEVSEALVELLIERGVENTRHADMFALRESFARDRFGSVLAIGTQVGLVGSMASLREFLGDLAFVTTPDASAVIDCYDPDRKGTSELLGYRDDITPGLASRVLWFEYEGKASKILCFRLFSPTRLREAAVGTGWEVSEIRYSENGVHYRAALRKRRRSHPRVSGSPVTE